MKAKLLTISAAVMALLAVSCQREETGFGLPAGEEVTVTISASVPSGGPSVKSNADPGNGDQINRCILGVYMVDGENEPQLYGTRVYKQVTGGQATFEDVTLLTGYDYKLVFWADNVASTTDLQTDNHYVTTDFPTVTYNTADGHQYMSSDDTRDAFYGVFELNDFSGEVQDSYTLTRPFGQLNIFTTDYDDIKMEALKPAKVQMVFTSIPTGMNLISGTLTEPAADAGGVTGEISAIPDGITSPVVTGAQQLSFDYIFAPKGQQRMISGITMRFYDGDGNELGITSYSFPELPVQANYRTNVSGALLTKSADLKIDISEDFDGTLEKDVYTVSTLAQAEQILNDIASSASPQPEIISITVEDQIPSTEGQNFIELPAITTEVELNLQGGIASDATLTVQDVMTGTGRGNYFTGRLVLSNQSTEQQGTLVINLPEGSAEVAGGSYTSVQVTTADDTFILGEGGDIETLTVHGGNVEIYGRVGSIDFQSDDSYVKVYTVYDATAFEYAASLIPLNRCASIVLGDDIDLEGSAENKWTPIDAENTRFAELDGAGHTLSNLYVDNFTGNENVDPYYYGGLFYVLQGDVRSLTIDGAEVRCHRGGALVGRMDYGTVQDCHVKNAKVHSFQKAAGLIGFVSNSSKDVTVSGCSVEDCQVLTVASEVGLLQAGGLIGYLQSFDRNVLVENCSVSGITFDKVYESADDVEDKVYDMEQYYSHPFIGTIANFTTGYINSLIYKVELKSNTVDEQMSDIPTCDRTNEYTGWWAGHFNSAGYEYSTKLIIDGETLDCWIEAKRLAAQIEAGGDVTIWRSYDFTKCTELPEKIEIRKPTNLLIKSNAVFTVGNQQLTNCSTLTVTGEPGTSEGVEPGTMKAKEYVLYNEYDGELIINSGTFIATAKGANGVAVYNRGKCHILDGTFEGKGFTVMSSANTDNSRTPEVIIDGGRFTTSGEVAGYALATTNNTKATINGGYIEAIQTASKAEVVINNGTIANKIRYYAIYNAGADVKVNGGYFSGYTGMKDIYHVSGTTSIAGGFFEDNQAALPEGYEYQSNVQTINGITYNYEVVKTN